MSEEAERISGREAARDPGDPGVVRRRPVFLPDDFGGGTENRLLAVLE